MRNMVCVEQRNSESPDLKNSYKSQTSSRFEWNNEGLVPNKGKAKKQPKSTL